MAKSVTNVESTPLPGLAVGAAHDLRNVLFVVSAHCHRLLQSTGPSDPTYDDLTAIKDATDRGVALARQILSNARAQDAEPRSVDVNNTIAGLEPLLKRLVGDGVEVVTRLGARVWPVQATVTQIEQVVMNLAINARDAMPHGGRIVITTENRSVTTSGAAAAAQYLVLSVADTGVGMDADLQERIFEPHFTTKREIGGTGIGLATVRAIALSSGGHIEVSSAPGEGTTMRVVLPRASTATPLEIPIRVSVPIDDGVPEPTVAGRRILLVEDETGVRELLHRWLASQGYEVRVASTGEQALALIQREASQLDVVLTDWHLPDSDGPTVAARLRARWPSVPVVFMSGETEALRKLEAVEHAVVLLKPFSMSELAGALKTAVTTRQAA